MFFFFNFYKASDFRELNHYIISQFHSFSGQMQV